MASRLTWGAGVEALAMPPNSASCFHTPRRRSKARWTAAKRGARRLSRSAAAIAGAWRRVPPIAGPRKRLPGSRRSSPGRVCGRASRSPRPSGACPCARSIRPARPAAFPVAPTDGCDFASSSASFGGSGRARLLDLRLLDLLGCRFGAIGRAGCRPVSGYSKSRRTSSGLGDLLRRERAVTVGPATRFRPWRRGPRVGDEAVVRTGRS